MRQVKTTLYKFEELRPNIQEKVFEEFMKLYEPTSYLQVLEWAKEYSITIEESAETLRAYLTPREELILCGGDYLYDGTYFCITANSDS